MNLHRAARYIMPYLVIVMTGLLLLNAYAIIEANEESKQRDSEIANVTYINCQHINTVSKALVGIMERAEALVVERALTQEEKEIGLKFYHEAINELNPIGCKHQSTVQLE